LLYAEKAGLDVEKTLQLVSGGAAGSWSLTNYGPRMINRNFDPGFFVEHFVKVCESLILFLQFKPPILITFWFNSHRTWRLPWMKHGEWN